jgi:hypothetical protein
MIDVRIICTHDAAPFAETLRRLLSAEQHNVRLCVGRKFAHEIEAARGRKEAVLLVWSYDAPVQHYMLEWANAVDPARLVEVARAPGAPKLGRRAPVIDFANWRGERGSRAWLGLVDRLRAVTRVLEPPKPAQMQATLALGMASAAAVVGAVYVRANDTYELPAPIEQQAELEQTNIAMGGALEFVEPASADEGDIVAPALAMQMSLFEPTSSAVPLQQIAALETLEIRDPTLLEQLARFVPQRNESGFSLASASSAQPVQNSPAVYLMTHLE